MHLDLETLDSKTPLRSQICVIGAGIAGLILAHRLAERGFDVHLLEAGGLDFEERSQSLYAAEMGHSTHTGTTEGRFRTFGGSSTRWGAQLLPYTPDIFAPAEGTPSSGWPLQEAVAAPYYAAIEQLMQVDPLPFTAELFFALGHAPLKFSEDFVLRFSKWAPFARRNLAQTIGREVLAHARITVYTHANVASLHSDGDAGHISFARVLNYAQREFRFLADHFVVTTGTVESSRLLLLSPGVPNPYDQLGRYFHDHISFHAAQITGKARAQVLDRLGPFFVKGTLHTCKIEASVALRVRESLLAVMGHFTVEEPEDSGAAAMRNLLRSLQQGRLKNALGKNLSSSLRNIPEMARLVWNARVHKRRAVSHRAILRLNIDMEQHSDAASRIALSDTTDALGLRKAIVHWNIGEDERETAHRFAHSLKQELERLGIAPIAWSEGLLEGRVPAMTDTFHPMGGLRMGTDITESVVDTDLKVHGLDNLHVASCAVFPSGGSSNPTFTMMALAMRLADHLKV